MAVIDQPKPVPPPPAPPSPPTPEPRFNFFFLISILIAGGAIAFWIFFVQVPPIPGVDSFINGPSYAVSFDRKTASKTDTNLRMFSLVKVFFWIIFTMQGWDATALGAFLIPPSVSKYSWNLRSSGVVMIGVAPEPVNQFEQGKWAGWYVNNAEGTKYSHSSTANEPFGAWPKGKRIPDDVILTLDGPKLFLNVDGSDRLVFDNIPRTQKLRLSCKLEGKGSSVHIR